MDMLLNGILIAIFCSCLSLVAHLAISCIRKGRPKREPSIFELNRQAKLTLSIWLFSFLIYVWIFFLLPLKIDIPIEIIGFTYGLFFYFALSFIYLSIYYFIDRSVSATILELIYSAPDEKLTLDEIKKVYPPEKKFEKELKGMLEGGFLIKETDFYKNSLKGSIYARIARLIKTFLKLGPGG